MEAELQKLHYDQIGARYEAHYGDLCSLKYRQRFINQPMFGGLNLEGMKVLEAMSGSGQTTDYLLLKGADVTGLDISPKEIASFRRSWPDLDAHCASILDSNLPGESFDLVAIVGGLHHLHPHTSRAVLEIHRLLKPGGYFCFAEPHKGSLPDAVRQFWYKYDKLFAPNEASIDLEELKAQFASRFDFRQEKYLGNIAYLLVLNSMIFRISVRLKPLYAPPVMACEALINKLLGRKSACFVVCQWQKIQS